MKKTIVIIALGISILMGAAHAQEPAKLALSEKLLTVMEMQKTIEQSFSAITKMIPGNAAQSPEAKNVFDMIMKELSWANIKDGYIKLYAEVFTEEELKGLISFYESPAGQAFVKKQPELTQKSMALSQQMMMKIMPKLQGMPR